MGNSNQVDVGKLATATVSASADVLSLHGQGGKDLMANWREIFNSCRVPETKVIDWYRLKHILWDHVSEEVLTGEDFRLGFCLICLKLLTQEEGMQGERVIFSRPVE